MISAHLPTPFVSSEVETPERGISTSAFGPKFVLSAVAKPQAEGLDANGHLSLVRVVGR